MQGRRLMVKTAPSAGRIAAMVVFALSCFGLLLFLWSSFGGSVPLRPKGYRFDVAFAKAFQLPEQAPVREAGVPVGRVVSLRVDPHTDRTIATIEIDPRYAPLRRDAHAILRQKSVGGETYVAITHGTRTAPAMPDGGRLPDAHVLPVQTIEDVFQIFTPRTRERFRTWQRDLGAAVNGRGADLNSSFGQLPRLTSDADRTLTELDEDRRALRGLIRDGATTFAALSADASALRTTVTSFDTTLSATAAQDAALTRSVDLFPSFLRQSRTTLRELGSFAVDADPLVVKLRPALGELPPALHEARLLAPDLRRLYEGLGPALTAARAGLPATSGVLDGLRPVLDGTGPVLEQLNPVLEWLALNQGNTSDFFSEGLSALASRLTPGSVKPSIGHYLRQIDPGGAENSVIAPTRASSNRGNAYPNGLDLGPIWQQNEIQPSFDCSNTGGAHRASQVAGPACLVQAKRFFQGRTQGQYPHAEAGDYRGG
jgi:phospholipid/cholesterol/gamma-HCH transport system substrate-binding protein